MSDKLSGIRSRNYNLVLYPDSEEHVNVLAEIRERYDYVGILHDKDVYDSEDELKNPEHKSGQLKKPHYHIILTFGSARYLTALSKDLNLPVQYIIKSGNIKRDMRYLVHADDKDKFQYSPDEVFGTLIDKFNAALEERSENDVFMSMFELLEQVPHAMSVSDLSCFFAKYGYFGQFRRNFALWNKLLIEHNIHVGSAEMYQYEE